MAPKSKPAATNGAVKKPKSATPSGTASPAVTVTEVQEFTYVVYGTGKPDKALYDAEQNKIKAEIDALQVKLVCPRVRQFLLREASYILLSRPRALERSQGEDCAKPKRWCWQRAEERPPR